uniref:phospholipase A2 n=1 Tax=Timema californicum TaxID=61474 RepID=A0A7R9P4H9_TIMCA|nr:unnamed protein product [Timema californicum]
MSKPEEAKELLTSLRPLSQHITIRFKEMVQLMSQCDSLNSPLDGPQEATDEKRGGRTVSGFTVLSGILPGTKWCGLGDLAQNYHDLGSETKIDKCCRSHDICPVKVRAHDSRYDLKNTDFYTKKNHPTEIRTSISPSSAVELNTTSASHCECDRRLYECLKATRRATADTMGSFYFNILRVPCVDDVVSSGQSEDRNSSTTKIFRKARKRYRR